MLNRPHNHHLIATFVEYVESNHYDEFVKLFKTVKFLNNVLRISLLQTHEGLTLYQHILKQNAKRFFHFLIENKFSEKDGEFETAPDYKRTIRYLVDLLDKPTTDEFHYWFDLLFANRHLVNFDINETYQDLTLLQHVCLSRPDLIDKLMTAGIGVNVAYSVDNVPNQKCVVAIDVLLGEYDEERKDSTLTELVRSGIMIYAARCNQPDILRRILKHRVDINMQGVDDHSALYHAAMREHFEIVSLLLAHGAEPHSVFDDAYAHVSSPMIEKLLFHGAGMFRKLPATFFQKTISVNYCYVEGMTVGDKPVTRNTAGFHNAFFSIEEMLAYKARQDSLYDVTIKQALPLHSISQCFTVLQSNPDIFKLDAFQHAMSCLRQANKVPSLQFIIKNSLQKNRFNRAFLHAASTSSMEHLLKFRPDGERASILGIAPDQQHALAVLNDRVDELVAFSEHAKKLKVKMARVDNIHAQTYGCSIICNIIGDAGFGIHGFASCCIMNGTDKVCCCCYSCVTTPMLGLGLPGFIALALSLSSVIIGYTYHHRTGNYCAEEHLTDTTLARRNHQLAAVLDALIVLMGNEVLPPAISVAVGNLAQPNITFPAVEDIIDKIILHYKSVELSRVRENKSETPLHAFSAGLFYWNKQQQLAHRNNKLPPLLRMNDDDFNIQTELGYPLFDEIDPNAPELEEDEPPQDDAHVPLIRMV